MSRSVMQVSEGISFIELTRYDVPTLYSPRARWCPRGVRQLFGIDMPVFEKRRFQHGAVARETPAIAQPRGRGGVPEAVPGDVRVAGLGAQACQGGRSWGITAHASCAGFPVLVSVSRILYPRVRAREC